MRGDRDDRGERGGVLIGNGDDVGTATKDGRHDGVAAGRDALASGTGMSCAGWLAVEAVEIVEVVEVAALWA